MNGLQSRTVCFSSIASRFISYPKESLKCDCRDQLEYALNYFESQNLGLLICLRQEGRGIGLYNKIQAYALQDKGLDTVEANQERGFPIDSRTYDLAISVLKKFNINSVKILTNNPQKINSLEKNGIRISERVSIRVQANKYNEKYLKTKQRKLNHMS